MADKKTIELNIETKKSEDGVKDIVDAIETLGNKLQDTTKDAEDLGKTIEAPAKKGIFKKLSGGAKGLAKGFGSITKAAGIFGLVTMALEKLMEMLKGSQGVVDAFAVGFEAIELVFSAVSNALKDVYENVSSSTENFDALGKVVKGIVTIAITPMKLGFQAIKAGIVAAQLAWEQSWLGNNDPERIAELKAELSDIGDGFVQIGQDVLDASSDIVNNFSEAITEATEIGAQIIEEVSKINVKAILDTAKANVEFGKQAKISAARNAGIIAEYEQQAEVQRQIRDNTELDMKSRIEANDKIKGIYAEQKKLLLANAQIQIDLAQGQLDKAEDNVEAQIALIEANNEYKSILESVNGKMSEFKTNETALRKENLDMINAEKEGENTRLIDSKRFNAEQITTAAERLEALKLVDAEERRIEEERLQGKIAMTKAGSQARVDAEQEYANAKQGFDQQDVSRNKEVNDQKLSDDQQLQDAKVAIASSALSSLSALTDVFASKSEENAKKAFKVQKALGMVQVGISTANAIMKAAAETTDPTPVQALRVGNMIAMGLAGVAQIAAIAGQKFQPSGGTATVTSPKPASGGGGGGPQMPPNFNVVGQSGTNQLAEAMGGQPPVQAFVVSGDVTTAQQLENNTIQQATF
tara:strand:+ start:17658 stop:19580 length:1923 start_codon:yes stop_codon:yes gene_type:complete